MDKVELSVYSDVYTLSFRSGVVPDEKTIQEVFKGCGFNGRRVVVAKERKEVEAFLTGARPVPEAPKDNSTTAGKVELGKKLFFDSRLSAHGKMSCASCHQPENGFAFPEELAPIGFNGERLPRNVPTIWNAGYRGKLFLDGRAKTLEEQALAPIQHPAELGLTLNELVARLSAVPEYAAAFQNQFGGPVTAERVAQAIAAFERTLISKNTPFDRYARGDKLALGDAAKRGFALFRDKANCITCHSGPDFTDEALRNIGTSWDGKQYKDLGRGQVTKRKGDNGKFRVPTLRELAWTAPYMHNGSMKTLDEVVDYYDRNGPKGLDTDLHGPLKLTAQEKKDLVEFLKSLSTERGPGAISRR